MRMLMNNLDPDVAERPDDLVVYGGGGVGGGPLIATPARPAHGAARPPAVTATCEKSPARNRLLASGPL